MDPLVDPSAVVGCPVDVAPFGRLGYWTGSDARSIEFVQLASEQVLSPRDIPEQGGPHVGIEWDTPRQVRSVRVEFEGPPPELASMKLQWWRHNWPVTWAGGWTAIDDPHNGRWVRAQSEVTRTGSTLGFTFDPLDIAELADAEDAGYDYRQTYKVRLLFAPGSDATVRSIEAISTSVWQRSTFQVTHCNQASDELSVRNGHVISSQLSGRSLHIDLLWTDCSSQVDSRLSPVAPDRTVVTVSDRGWTWSFAPEDVPIKSPDLGITVTLPDVDAAPQTWIHPPIYERIKTEPEQSYQRAFSEIPRLSKVSQQRYVPLGCEATRQEFALRYNGDVFADKHALKVSGRDTARLLWPGPTISYRFPSMDPPDFREREDAVTQSPLEGWMPIYTSRWIDREIEFEKTDFAALLYESPDNEAAKRGDEPVCLFSRVTLRNTTEDARVARLWLLVQPEEQIEVRGGFVYATGRIRHDQWQWAKPAVTDQPLAETYDSPRLRAFFDTGERGRLLERRCPVGGLPSGAISNAALYEIELAPRSSHAIDIRIPFITFAGTDGCDELWQTSFDDKLSEMSAFWKSKLAAGASVRLPEQDMDDFAKAVVAHVAITADKDPGSGMYLLPAATYTYNVCANEAMHQVRALDFLGYHSDAERYLEPFIRCQGTRPLHGKFLSQEGVLHGLKVDDDTDYQNFNYNLDHGFVLFALGEHYFLTGDEDWGRRVAPNMVAACDFVTRERKYTMRKPGSPEYGLLPPGHLEDNPEWLYWYAVNAYCYRGMQAAAEALDRLGHPDAGRVRSDAAAFRSDLRASMRQNMQLSPLVRLLDGSFIPFTPTRAGLFSRDLGWIRDSLYGPIHTIECGVLDPDEDQSSWILLDSEDNVFVNRYRGRQVDLDRFWFSHGGNTIQSGLLPMPMVYIKRDEPEHAIRSLINSFAQNIYPDVRCFTEHPVTAFGLGQGPFYKTPDECCWINWLRHTLVTETGDRALRIAPAVPRDWVARGVSAKGLATWFGPVTFEISYDQGSDTIRATIDPPRRNPPKKLELRLRHPNRKHAVSVTINGRPSELPAAGCEDIALDPAAGNTVVIEARY